MTHPNSSKHPYLVFLIFSGRRQWHPIPVLLPGKSHGRRSLVGCSPWDREELDTTEQLHFHFSLSCIGEGNGNPLQCSCLQNPRDEGAWWAAVYGVAQSWLAAAAITFSSKRNQSSLEKWLILTLGQEIYKVTLEHLIVPESSVVFKKPAMVELYQRDTGAN